MALLGGGNQNGCVEEYLHLRLRFQSGLDPLLADVLNDAIPVCRRFRATLMYPQTIDLYHGRPLLDSPEKHTFRLLNRFYLRIRFEAQPFPERLGDHDAPSFVDSNYHAIFYTIYH